MLAVLPYVLHGMFNREISLWYTILTPEKVCSAVKIIKKAMEISSFYLEFSKLSDSKCDTLVLTWD